MVSKEFGLVRYAYGVAIALLVGGTAFSDVPGLAVAVELGEQLAECHHVLGGPVGEVGNRALLDPLGHVGELRGHGGQERPVVGDVVQGGDVDALDPGERLEQDGLLDTLESEGIGCIAFSPLAQGMLTNKYLAGQPADSRVNTSGSLRSEFLSPENHKILSYLLRFENETILVVANLSRFTQFASVDLREFRDQIPVELFGLTEFPAITDQPYFITLGPHAFYWFQLRESGSNTGIKVDDGRPAVEIDAPAGWQRLVDGQPSRALQAALPRFIGRQRWYQGKTRGGRGLAVSDVITVPGDAPDTTQTIRVTGSQPGARDTRIGAI